MVLLWVPAEGPPTGFGSSGSLEVDGDAEFAKEHWRVRTMARTSMSEIYDMSWAPDGETLLVGGTDSVARIINAHDGE
jgi:chromatin assembly factor 1 subunit B